MLLLQNFDLPVPYSAVALRELPDTSSLYWTLVQKRALASDAEQSGLRVVRQRQPIVNDEGEEIEPAERVTPEWLEREGVRFVVALQAIVNACIFGTLVTMLAESYHMPEKQVGP